MSSILRSARSVQRAKRVTIQAFETSETIPPEISLEFGIIATASDEPQQRAIADLTDILLKYFVQQGLGPTREEFTEQSWVSPAKQMEETFERMTDGNNSLKISSSDFFKLLSSHFEMTEGKLEARVNDTYAYTTLSALSYCAMQLADPQGNYQLSEFSCELNQTALVAA